MAQQMAWLLVTVLSVLIFNAKADWTNTVPGFKTRITQSGLKFINDIGVELLTQDIKGESIPDISGTAHVSVIGNVDYTVSNMRITGFSIPTTSLKTAPGVGLQFTASGGAVSINGADWRYKYKKGFVKISDHGTFDATANGLNLKLAVKLGKDKTGRPTIAPAGCTGGVGSIKVKFHGGASWLYNLFSGSIESSMKKSLKDKICDVITQEINTRGAEALAALKLKTPVGPYTEIDYSLVANPAFDTLYLETSHRGEFYPTGKFDKEAPIKVPVIETKNATSKMVYMWITDYVLNTAGYVFQEIGKLTYNITDDMIPPTSPYHLNTTDLGILIPQLGQMYPNMLMELVINSTQPPTVDFSDGGATGTLWGDLDAYVVMPNGTRTFVFTIGIIGHGNGTIGFSYPNITGKVTSMSVEMKLKRTDIGYFSLLLIRPAINILIDTGVIPYLNEEGKEGFPIPQLDGLTLINPAVSLGKDYIQLESDLKYTPLMSNLVF
ncbi:bactericidal permeability-increasing protein-like [Glandiceps talaboti]